MSIGNEVSMKNRILRILPTAVFDVALPSLDVYSDLSLIIGWFWAGHPIYAWTMTDPVLLQFMSTAYKWYQVDKPQTKKWSWILLFLQFWPQFRALRVIRLLYKNDFRANEKKKKMMTDISSTEPYLEAWPSVMAMTAIWMHADATKDFSPVGASIDNSGAVIGVQNDEIHYGNLGQYRFFFSFSVSFLTAGLGLTKLFLVGPCPILSQEGPLDGLCTWRFILCFLGVLSSMFTKAFFIGLTINTHLDIHKVNNSQLMELLLCLLLQFLPNMILSTISIHISTGLNQNFRKVLFGYPGVWLLPVATYFSVGPKKLQCSRSNVNTRPRRKLGFSKIFTIVNMAVTINMFLVVYLITDYYLHHKNISSDITNSSTGGGGVTGLNYLNLYELLLLSAVISVILNIIFMVLDLDCCCNQSQSCFPSCCCGPTCFKLKYEYIDTNEGIEIWKCDDKNEY